jgi:glycosyltransferase involved in cell wall biosynthesis
VVDGVVARRLGICTISTAHGFTGGDLKNRFYEWLQLRSLRRFDAVVAVSRALVHRLAEGGVARERIVLLPNAWSPTTPPYDRGRARSELELESDRFHALWIGRLSREKGADVFIQALTGLKDLPIRASIIGDGAERSRLQAHARQQGLADTVRWWGLLPNAARYLKAFDVLVLSSRTEGTPLTLLEAMAAGVPIVATAVGGVPDMISLREAFLVPSESPQALGDAIRDVYQNSSAAAQRARAAQDRLRTQFDHEFWLTRYEQIYQQAQRSSGLSR